MDYGRESEEGNMEFEDAKDKGMESETGDDPPWIPARKSSDVLNEDPSDQEYGQLNMDTQGNNLNPR